MALRHGMHQKPNMWSRLKAPSRRSGHDSRKAGRSYRARRYRRRRRRARASPRRTSRDSASTASPSRGSRPARARLRAPSRSCRTRSVALFAVPRRRGRIDQVAERVERALAEPQEEPRRQARRAPGIGLRLALVGEHGVEDMRAEAGLGGMAAGAMLVAEEAVQPAVGLAAGAEIIEQLEMPIAARQRRAVAAARRDRARPIAPRDQPAEAAARDLAARRGHRRRSPPAARAARSPSASAAPGCATVRAAGSAPAADSPCRADCRARRSSGSGLRSVRSTLTCAMRRLPPPLTS